MAGVAAGEPPPIVSTPVQDGDLDVARRCQAIVLSQLERSSCRPLIDAGVAAGATVAITAGAKPTELLLPGAGPLELEVPQLALPVDDLGAGDVFAAAFFIALSQGSTAADAVRFASAAAAVRMSGQGAAAIGTRPQVELQLSRSQPDRSGPSADPR